MCVCVFSFVCVESLSTSDPLQTSSLPSHAFMENDVDHSDDAKEISAPDVEIPDSLKMLSKYDDDASDPSTPSSPDVPPPESSTSQLHGLPSFVCQLSESISCSTADVYHYAIDCPPDSPAHELAKRLDRRNQAVLGALKSCHVSLV